MIVQQFLRAIPFDEIVKGLYPDLKSLGHFGLYKEAYDQLCNIVPESDGRQVTFDISKPAPWSKSDRKIITANDVEGQRWENIAGNELIKPNGNEFTDTELAAAILWGSTFYGFTQITSQNYIDDILKTSYTDFGRRAKYLMVKREMMYLYNKEDREKLKQQLKEPKLTYYMTSQAWHRLGKRKAHRNRSKRKRDWRIHNRIECLKKLDKRQNLINKLKPVIDMAKPDFNQLCLDIYHADAITEYWRETFCYHNMPRMDYLEELMATYSNALKNRTPTPSKLLIVVHVSMHHPLSLSEKGRLESFLKDFYICLKPSPKILYAYNKTDSHEMQLQFIEIKSKA